MGNEVLKSNETKTTIDLLVDLKNELKNGGNIDDLKNKIRQKSKSDRLEILREAEKQNSETPDSQGRLYNEKVINAIVEVQKEKGEETNKDGIKTLRTNIKENAYKKIENLNIFGFSISNLPDFIRDSLRAYVDKKTMSKEEFDIVEKEKLKDMDFMDKMMYNMEKGLMGFVGAGLFTYLGSQLPNLDEELSSVNNFQQVANNKIIEIKETSEREKSSITEVGEEVKNDVKKSWNDFTKKFEESYNQEKEKLELKPEIIYKGFINKYIDILIGNKGEKTKLMKDDYLTKTQDKTISELKNDNNELSKIMSSQDSINLLSPFLSNKDSLNDILDKEYIKKLISEDRLKKIKEEINKGSFDWKQIFTLQEISIIVPQKFTYIGSVGFNQVAKYLDTEQILSLDKDKINEIGKELSEESKIDFRVLKSNIFESTSISNLFEKNQKEISFYTEESEENNEKRKVYEFTKNIFSNGFIHDFSNNIGVNDLTENIKNSFNLGNMSKLYVLFNGKWEPNKWGDDQKITFITWLTTQLSHQNDDQLLGELTSTLLKKLVSDESENSFITNNMKNFFSSGGKLLGKNYLKDNLGGPFDSITGIIKNNLPKAISDVLPGDIGSKLPAGVAVCFGVLIMLYPAYRLTKLLTNPYVLSSIVGGSLAYSGYKLVEEPNTLDKTIEGLKGLFNK